MKRRCAVVVLAVLLHAGCGDEAVPDRPPPEPPAWPVLSDAQRAEADRLAVPARFENDLGMRFVLVPAGSFTMGSPEDEEGRPDEVLREERRRQERRGLTPEPIEPRREVAFESPFYLQITEVTYWQYTQCDPDWWKRLVHPPEDPSELHVGDSLPIMAVTVREAHAFAVWLSQRDPVRTYRLPTEAEWEYACRAGTRTRFFWGDDLAATHRYAHVRHALLPPLPTAEAEARRRMRLPVGSLEPNPWGLYDMLGNVNEWCADTWEGRGKAQVIRGGSFWNQRAWISFRCASRDWATSLGHTPETGFRLLASLPEKGE